MADAPKEEVKKQSRIYWIIGGALILLTAVTFLNFALGTAVSVALLIAGLQALLAASVFMHLISEKRVIFILIAFTVLMLLAIIFLPVSASFTNVGVDHVP
jgi:caa(3)-type oxidase subunit IV